MELEDIKSADDVDRTNLFCLLKEYVLKVDVPLCIVLAQDGIMKTIPEPRDQWIDLSWTGSKVIDIPGGHLSMFDSFKLVEELESGWQKFDIVS